MIRIDSNYPIEEMLEFCKESQNDTRPGAVNMDFVDWENKPHTLLYLLYKEKRFDGPTNGYVMCKKEGRIVCGHGFYVSEIDRMVCMGCRTYTVPGINCHALQGDIKDFIFDIARENGIEGTAVVQFVVDRDGTVKDVSVLKEIGGGCGEEASRVVNTMNESGIKWTPGRQRGRPVKVQFRLPVRFKLQ